jgi:predicted glutamine amidotransferase
MCGIAGIMMYPKNRSANELEFIKELASELAIENQARGTHATGIATFGENGYDVLKHNIRADELTQYDAWIDFLDKNITNETYSILVHTRMATQGSPSNNDNNHPIVTATNIGVHNGMIYNDDSLFHKEGLSRQAEVDSEAIFRLIDKELGNDRGNTKNVAEKLSGVYAVAFVKKEERNILNYFRNSNPTTFAYIPSLNIVVFASLEKFIKDAIITANKYCNYISKFTLDISNIEYFSPKQDIIMQFDVSENTPTQQLHQEPLKFTENYAGYYGGGGWYDEDEWYYRDFRDRGRTNTAYGYDTDVDTEDYTNIYDFIDKKGLEHLMSSDDYSKMIELLDLDEKNEWTKGYKSGRESLDNEIKILKEEKSISKLAN